MYLQKHNKTIKKNIIAKFILSIVICFLTCFEKCMKYLNQNAYIQTAIHGTSFIIAAKDAFFLIARNIFTIGAVISITNFGLVIIKLFVCISSTAASYFYIDSVI